MPEIRSVRSLLRAATAEHHARVDQVFGQFDLADPADYRRFLAAQAQPLVTVEAAITAFGPRPLVPDWAERRREGLIAADLADLDLAMPRPEPMGLDTAAAMLGALYVLEGSRLGGTLLARRVPMDLPARFMRCPPAPERWRGLIEIMDSNLQSDDQRSTAIETARSVFDRFWRSAREHGRTPVVE